MTDEMDLKSVLDWYVWAGVEETAGGVPFALAVEEAPTPVLKKSVKLAAPAPRQATTALAQTTVDACINARERCLKIDNLNELKTLVENFEGCALKLTASHTVFGDGCTSGTKVLLVGEAPGADEDRIGRPFVGRSGQLLDKMLAAIGLDRSVCYITNVLPWRPPGNRTPTDGEIAVCLPFLKRQIDLINPDYIFILGGSAANALLDQQESISRLRGHWLEYKTSSGRTIEALASFHPAYLLRNPGQKGKLWTDLLRLSKKLSNIL